MDLAEQGLAEALRDLPEEGQRWRPDTDPGKHNKSPSAQKRA